MKQLILVFIMTSTLFSFSQNSTCQIDSVAIVALDTDTIANSSNNINLSTYIVIENINTVDSLKININSVSENMTPLNFFYKVSSYSNNKYSYTIGKRSYISKNNIFINNSEIDWIYRGKEVSVDIFLIDKNGQKSNAYSVNLYLKN